MTRAILRYRILVIVLLLAISIPIGVNIRHLTKDAGVSSLVPETHPAYAFSNRVEELFGATDQIVIGVTSEKGIYKPEALQLIDELTRFFENMEELDPDDVVSLTNVKDMQGREGSLIIEPLVEEEDLESLDRETIEGIRERVRSNPLYRGKLVSSDEKSAVVLAGVPTELGLEEDDIASLKERTLDKLNDLRNRYPSITLDFSGPAMLKAYISEYMQKDLQTLFPLAILIVALLIFFLLRSFFGMLMPILVTLFAVIWTFGLKAGLGSPITIVETAMPVVLIAIGCADGIHIMSEFLFFHRKGMSSKEAALETMKVLTLPVVLTSLTTGLGFLSLVTAPGVSIRNMGVFLAFGVMVAMVFSLVFIPALVSFLPGRHSKNVTMGDQKGHRHAPEGRFHSFAVRFSYKVIEKRKSIALAAVILLIISILGVFNIKVESDEIRYLKKSNEFRQATENIQDNLGGITSLDIVIEGNESDFLKQPSVLKAMEDLQRFCEQDDLVSYSLSLVDLIKRINYVLHDNKESYDRLPNETEQVPRRVTETVNGKEVVRYETEEISGKVQVAQYLFLYELSGGESLDQHVDPDYRIGRISVRLKDMSSRRLEDLLAKIRPYIREHFPEDAKVRFANHYIRVVMMDLIIDSQIYSLLTVLATITILMSIMFRSPVVGVFTALPVFIAVLFNFAIMWVTGVTLNIGTSIIASVGMGVGIDYAIHYYTRFRMFYREGKEYDEAVSLGVSETARAILSNASAVGIGFMVLLFSEYGVIANVGWITAVSMFTTAFGSLVILPALLSIFKPKVR